MQLCPGAKSFASEGRVHSDRKLPTVWVARLAYACLVLFFFKEERKEYLSDTIVVDLLKHLIPGVIFDGPLLPRRQPFCYISVCPKCPQVEI